ncbi:hypothetical protein ACTMU2_16050 [Cupriavidus basilensis]
MACAPAVPAPILRANSIPIVPFEWLLTAKRASDRVKQQALAFLHDVIRKIFEASFRSEAAQLFNNGGHDFSRAENQLLLVVMDVRRGAAKMRFIVVHRDDLWPGHV